MADLLQLVFAGLSQGAVYALVAIGFVAVFAVSGVINLVQGEFAALAGLVAISATASGLPLAVALPLALASAALAAAVLERVVIRPVRTMTTLTSIILTLGVSTALKAAMLLVYGPDARGLQPFTDATYEVGGVSIRAQELWILAVAAVVAGAVFWFYERTVQGKALRACAEQPVAARLVGISPGRASLTSFLVAGLVGPSPGSSRAPSTSAPGNPA